MQSSRTQRRPLHEGSEEELQVFEADANVDEQSFEELLTNSVSILRRRKKLITLVWLLVSLPVFLYALMAVPRYTARGAVQVGGTAGINGGPLAEMLGTGSQTEVQTEVEIMRRREFLADVLTRLNLQIRDPNRDLYLTTDIEVASEQSPRLTYEFRLCARPRPLPKPHRMRFKPFRLSCRRQAPTP